MNLKTFIIIGQSGSGKGTQARILETFLRNQDPERRIFHLETGARFREFIQGDSHSSKLAKEIMDTGGRQPDFLAVWNWAHLMLEQLQGGEHMIIDGTPRSYEEAVVLDTAMTFYKRLKPTVIYLEVSREWSHDRILGRAAKEGRGDDQNDEMINKRLDWFQTEVMRAVKFFEKNNGYTFIHINGEQSIEKVAEDIQRELVS